MKATNNTFFGKKGLIAAGAVGTAICLLSLSLCLAQEATPSTAPATGPQATTAPTTLPSLDTTLPAWDHTWIDTTMPATVPAAPCATTLPTTWPSLSTTLPTTLPAIATTEPVANGATSRPCPTGTLTLNFRDAQLKTVMEYLSDAAGMIVIEEDKVEGRVTLMSRQKISCDEALSLLDSVLKQKGFAAIRVGRTLKIVTLEKAKKENNPVQVGCDPASIEQGDRVITQIIPIQYADATKLKTDLASLIPSTADFTANASSNTVVITGSQTSVRHLVEIIKAIDTHMNDVSQVKVFALKYANATSAAKLITDIFNDTGTGGNQSNLARIARIFRGGGPGGGGPFGAFGGGGPGGAGGTTDDAKGHLAIKVTASADDRTNTIVVSAPTEIMKVIEGVVKELDANPAQAQAVFIYHLKNGVAADLQGTLNNIFGTGSGGSSISSTSNRTTSGTSNTTFGGSGGSAGLGRSLGSGTGSSGSMSTGSNPISRTTPGAGTSGSSSGNRPTSLSPQNQASASDLIGQVYVVAEPDTNSLLVSTSSANFERVKAIIADLDRAVPQVLIKVLIAEVTHNDSLDLGLEFSGMDLSGFKAGPEFGIGAGITANNTTGAPNGFVFTLDQKYFTAALNALANSTKLDVLSRPYILTSDNQEAQVMVGDSVPFVTGTSTFETGATSNTIQYQNIGVILDVTPHINPAGLVTMDIYPQTSSLTGQTVPLGGGLNAPVFAMRYAQARVAIRDGQTIVIGGLMQDQLTKNVNKVPFLGDIPCLGLLFQSMTETKTKTELLIFITPHVALQPDELQDMSKQEKAGLKIVPNAVAPGLFDEHMKGLERGASTRPAIVAPDVSTVDVTVPTTEPAGPERPEPKPNGAQPNGAVPGPNAPVPVTPVGNVKSVGN